LWNYCIPIRNIQPEARFLRLAAEWELKQFGLPPQYVPVIMLD